MRACDSKEAGVVSSLLAVPPPQRKEHRRSEFYGAVIDASFASDVVEGTVEIVAIVPKAAAEEWLRRVGG